MLTLKIETDNAAFEQPTEELARILRDAADKIERGVLNFTLMDINGNRVGAVHCGLFLPAGKKG